MKVTGAGKSTTSGATSRVSSARGEASFRVTAGDSTKASAPVLQSPGPMLGALIALQAADTAPERDRRAASLRMLDLLESLKAGLLDGAVRIDDLQALSDFASAKAADDGSGIARIHAEIALRARVELAKLGR